MMLTSSKIILMIALLQHHSTKVHGIFEENIHPTVYMDTGDDVQKQFWRVLGTYEYLDHESELTDPKYRKLLPNNFFGTPQSRAEGLWLVFPATDEANRAKGKPRFINTVTFYYEPAKDQSRNITVLNQVSVKFKASSNGTSVSIFTPEKKYRTDINNVDDPNFPFDWTTFDTTLEASSMMSVHFTVREEWDFIIVDSIRMEGTFLTDEVTTIKDNRTPEPEPTEELIETSTDDEVIREDEFGLILILKVNGSPNTNPCVLTFTVSLVLSVMQYYF